MIGRTVRARLLGIIGAVATVIGTAGGAPESRDTPPAAWNLKDKVVKADAEWRRALTPTQYRVLRAHGTEPAFTGALWNQHLPGLYRCAGCGLELFSAGAKFDSGMGWPSFWQPIKAGHIAEEPDRSLFIARTEVHCARCGGHLGHVFDDGPKPTGRRYCINSAALTFEAGP